MATEVTQSWEGQVYRDGASPSSGKTFMVTFDRGERATPAAACSARGVPQRGDALAGADWLVVTDIEARPLGPLCYEVSVTYGAPTAEEQEEQEPKNIEPWRQPWSIAVRTQTESVAYDFDVLSKKVRNSAGSPFDPPDQREETDLVIQVVRNHVTYDLDLARDYSNSTNEDMFLGYPTGSVRVNISGDYQQEFPWVYWRVTYELRFRDGRVYKIDAPWDARIADQGFQELARIGDDGVPILRAILDDDGRPVSEPHALKGGAKSSTLTWLRFQRYPRLRYAKLGLEKNIKLALAGKWLQL
ncbi:MAG: hypothetical protein KKB38_20645 [Gammaproteobacteria bacterium]|nr:hypothetical protein [Gammaproteobacteria bacterium]